MTWNVISARYLSQSLVMACGGRVLRKRLGFPFRRRAAFSRESNVLAFTSIARKLLPSF
jgi:hypothetical protein